MKRLNFTLDDDTVKLLEKLAGKYYRGNKSQTVRAALESLASHAGQEGWVIKGYTPLRADHSTQCHECGTEHTKGAILFKPVFERGSSPSAIKTIPSEEWVECPDCLETK
ncbi:MAG: hypothetical protein R6V27_06995 [Balneolaceae bacterium]